MFSLAMSQKQEPSQVQELQKLQECLERLEKRTDEYRNDRDKLLEAIREKVESLRKQIGE